MRHFLTLQDLTPEELHGLVARSLALKALQRQGTVYEPLKNKVLGMVFEKSSTRTRVSFEVAMAQFGGHAIFLSPRDTQLGRGELIEDTARVLSRMVDAVMLRTFEHEKVDIFAEYATVPVINGLTDLWHPCQMLADVATFVEHRGAIEGRRIAYIGDGNNMCNTYVAAAAHFGFELTIATPEGYEPDPEILAIGGEHVTLTHDPHAAAQGADMIATDVWTSMGQEQEQARRMIDFAPFQITSDVMARANPDAIFTHCLPAHRGEEVSAEVIDGPQSVVFDQAEHRLHSQKALLEFLLT